jgi:hypothetical protein
MAGELQETWARGGRGGGGALFQATWPSSHLHPALAAIVGAVLAKRRI